MVFTENTLFIRVLVFYRVLCGIFKVLPSLKMLCSRVLASFAGHRRLPRSLASFRWTNETAMASFQLRKYVVTLVINPVTTGSLLIVAHWQISFLAICACCQFNRLP